MRTLPSEALPVIRKGRAPIMCIGLLFAADMEVVVLNNWLGFNPSALSNGTPASVDWQPVSAMAGVVTGPAVAVKAEVWPRSRKSAGSALTETSMNGWGSDERRSHA